MNKVPKNLQGVLWSNKVSNLDLKKDKTYIIHQILAYGTWEQLSWLFKTYPKSEIKKIFLEFPTKNYTHSAFNFVANLLLEIKSQKLDLKRYVKTYPRVID